MILSARNMSPSIQYALVKESIVDEVVSLVKAKDPHFLSVDLKSETSVSAAVSTLVWKWVNKTTALVAEGFHTSIVVSVYLAINGEEIRSSTILSNALSHMNLKSVDIGKPILQAYNEGVERKLVVTLPKWDNTTPQMDTCVALLLNLCSPMLGVHIDNVSVFYDKDKPKDLSISAGTLRVLERLLEASKSSIPVFAGDIKKYELGLSANLVELLALSRQLRVWHGRYRRHGKTSITLEHIRSDINTFAGIANEGNSPYLKSFIQALLSESVKVSNPLPTTFLGALRIRNGHVSDEGIVQKLGYTPVCPSFHKIQKVLLNRTKGTNKEGIHVDPITKRSTTQGTTPTEFYSAIKMSLPYYKPNSPKGLLEQLNLAPMKVQDVDTLRIFTDMHADVDRLNAAYATLQAAPIQKSKATYGIFNKVRSVWIGALEKRDFKYTSGVYPDLKAIPQEVISEFERTFRKRLPKPRTQQTDVPADQMQVDQPDAGPSTARTLDTVAKVVKPKGGSRKSNRSKVPTK